MFRDQEFESRQPDRGKPTNGKAVHGEKGTIPALELHSEAIDVDDRLMRSGPCCRAFVC